MAVPDCLSPLPISALGLNASRSFRVPQSGTLPVFHISNCPGMDELAAPRLTPDDKMKVAELRKATINGRVPHYEVRKRIQPRLAGHR